MIKPAHIRRLLTRANPHLADHPEKLHVFLDTGAVAALGSTSLSFEYRYTLNLLVQDYPHHVDRIVLPLLAYLRTQQPELFENHDKAQKLLRFEVEIINESVLDLSIQVDLTERVLVSKKKTGNELTALHVGEPEHPDFPAKDVTIEVYDAKTNTSLGSFTVPAWNPYGG